MTIICYCGGDCKKIRVDKQCTDEGTLVLIHMKCKSCSAKFTFDELIADEKDFEGSENINIGGVEYG